MVVFEDRYEIYEDGKISDKKTGMRLMPYKTLRERPSLYVSLNDRKYQLSRLIYEVFSGEKLASNEIVTHKDGDFSNCAFDNLEKITRNNFMKDTKNHSQKIDEATAEQIRNRYLIENMGKVKPGNKANLSTKMLAEEYDVSVTTIINIINNKYRKEEKR